MLHWRSLSPPYPTFFQIDMSIRCPFDSLHSGRYCDNVPFIGLCFVLLFVRLMCTGYCLLRSLGKKLNITSDGVDGEIVPEISTWQPNRLDNYPLPKALCGTGRNQNRDEEKRGGRISYIYNNNSGNHSSKQTTILFQIQRRSSIDPTLLLIDREFKHFRQVTTHKYYNLLGPGAMGALLIRI